MIFGHPSDFAIEVDHEPSGAQWGGFGRMAIHRLCRTAASNRRLTMQLGMVQARTQTETRIANAWQGHSERRSAIIRVAP